MALNAVDKQDLDAERLAEFVRQYPRLCLLTGAGCSTASGIPEYRDDDGNWKHAQPMQFADFVGYAANRRRYWARSFAGWERIARARPNAAHQAIARLEEAGMVNAVITQNVDNLHRAAGSRNVIDLHGTLAQIRCLDCDRTDSRQAFQVRLKACNPDWNPPVAALAPDGDASLSRADFAMFQVPGCSHCNGIVKPHVVFFGEAVPAERFARASAALEQSDALLVIGSSLMVFSGYRFVRVANERLQPIAIVNRGTTRADHLASLKLGSDCTELLAQTVTRLSA